MVSVAKRDIIYILIIGLLIISSVMLWRETFVIKQSIVNTNGQVISNSLGLYELKGSK